MTTGNLTIQDNDTVVQYTAVGESTLVFPFPILENDELKVSRNQVLLTFGVDYSITGLGQDGGGYITLLPVGTLSTPGDIWTLWQDMPIERLTGFSAGAAVILGTALNAEFSARLRVEQQLRREIRNSLRLPSDDPVSGQDMVLPSKVLRALKYLFFDANGLPTYAAAIAVTTLTPALIDSLLLGPEGTIKGRISAGTGLLENLTAKQARQVERIPDRALGVPVFGGMIFEAYGDSITAGNAAGAALCFAANLSSRIAAATYNNRAVSGTGVTKSLALAFANLPKYRVRNRVIELMAAFNDAHYYGDSALTRQKVRDVHRAFFARAFLKSAVSVEDASVVKTGAWVNATVGTWGDNASASLAGHAQTVTADATAKLSYAFTGESVVVGTWRTKAAGTYTQSDIDVYIDGVFVETQLHQGQTDGNLLMPDTYEGLTHCAYVYQNLGTGAHTIEVRAKTANRLMFDYFGTLADPSQCPPILVGEVPYVDAVGYATVETLRSRAIDDAYSAVIRAEVDLWVAAGYPVALVPVNDFYDAETQISGDHDHPGVAGHAAIARAFESRLRIVPHSPLISASLTKAATQAITTAVQTAISWSAVVGEAGFWNGANPTQIVAPMAGTMRISGTVTWATNAVGIRVVTVKKNGAGADLRQVDSRGAFAANDCCQAFCFDVPVVTGDFFILNATQNSGGNLNIQVDSQVDVTMIR